MRRPLQSPALINAFYDSLRPEQRETCMAMQRAKRDGSGGRAGANAGRTKRDEVESSTQEASG